jgi:hypothetical protein
MDGVREDRQIVDPADWEGETELLLPFVDDLIADAHLCDRVFSARHEALLAGLTLAELLSGGSSVYAKTERPTPSTDRRDDCDPR